jgi:hypothetical protein
MGAESGRFGDESTAIFPVVRPRKEEFRHSNHFICGTPLASNSARTVVAVGVSKMHNSFRRSRFLGRGENPRVHCRRRSAKKPSTSIPPEDSSAGGNFPLVHCHLSFEVVEIGAFKDGLGAVCALKPPLWAPIRPTFARFRPLAISNGSTFTDPGAGKRRTTLVKCVTRQLRFFGGREVR